MKILTRAIISNSEMIKNYKACREKTQIHGKLFVLKNNQPDAVLFSITEYKRISRIIEYMESLDEEDIAKFVESLPKVGNHKVYSMDDLKNDINKQEQLK
jgi:PHD/YefM family antitoxin component YafN of YafNO toxin-antitoxin module